MRHGVKKVKFNRNMGERKALLRSLLVALFTNEKVVTTKPKAKMLKQVSDHMISRAKKGDLATKRLLLSDLPHPVLVEKLVKEYGPLFKDRTGGYSRIISLGRRLSDSTPMVRIELVQTLHGDGKSEKKVKDEQALKALAVPKAGKAQRMTPKEETVNAQEAKPEKEKTKARRQVSTKKENKK